MTQEFHLSVTPVGNSQYLVRTERVPFGVPLAEEQLLWTVETWLTQARQLMSDPLQELMQGNSTPLNLVELGQELYTALFQGTLRDSWVIAQGVAQHRREALRLRLGLKGTDLPRLPWEVMYGTDVPVERLRRQPSSITSSPRPLATGTRIIFSRYQWGTRLVEENALPSDNQPLRILMVVSAPTDQEQLKLYREVKQMQQQLQTQPNQANGEVATDIQLTILNQPGRERLTQALVQGRYHALHYAGHSDLSAAGGSLYLVNNHTGLTEELTGDDLVELLVNNGIRLAVFNSCRSSYTAASDPSSGRDRNLAEVLVSRGIPAVLAMAEQIPDNVALNLTGLFYHNLKQGFPIDLSLNRARQGLISTYGSHQFYWALPVLYLHPEFDGYLINRDQYDNPADRLSLMPADRTPSQRPIDAPEPLERQPHRGMEEARVPNLTRANVEKLETLEDEAESESDRQVVAEMLQQLTPRAPQTYSSSATGSLSTSPANPFDANSLGPTLPADNQESMHAVGVPTVGVSTTTSVQPPLVEQQSSITPTERVPLRKSKKQPALIRFLLLPVLGATVGTLAYVAVQRLPIADQIGLSDSSTPPSPAAATIADPPIGIDPNQSDGELQVLATDNFAQQMIDLGIEAVKALLERNALTEASEAIQAVPEDFKDDPRINFLRGRLAWQGAAADNGIHTVTQAREFWESTVEADPEPIVYHEALAFAYYAEANWTKVIQTWYSVQSRPARDKNMLNIEAINTLTQKQIAATQSAEKQDAYLRAAVQNYRKVVNRDSESFTPEALRQNWLWTDAMIRDWEALAQSAQGKSGSNQSETNQSEGDSPNANPPEATQQ